MKPAISQVCTLDSPFDKDLEDYAASQCHAVEIWLTKAEAYIKGHSIAAAQELLQRHAITTPAASYQGGVLASQGDARREAWRLFEERLDLCRQLDVDVMVVACDVPAPLAQHDIERVRVSLRQAAEAAQRREVRLALEFQRSSALGNNLQTAAALVEEVGSRHLGLCLDAFHFYTGPSKLEDLALLTAENLFHVQLCDLADRPRELAADSDRILPGEGDIPLEPMIDCLRHIGYMGYVSLEVMNPQLWRVPPLQVSEIGITALRRLLGQART